MPAQISDARSGKVISFVLPFYNEGINVDKAHATLLEVTRDLPYEIEFVYVNDGSSDDTMEHLLQCRKQDPRVVVINFARFPLTRPCPSRRAAPRTSGYDLTVQPQEPSDATHRTLVVMPAWNEAEVIADTVTEVRRAAPWVDLLVIDDGSTDATAALAGAAGATVLRLPYNMGVGGALRAGFKYAWRNGYDQAIQVDADGQHDPRDIPKVLAGLADADIAIGARFAGEGAYEAKGPRRWAMRLLAGALSAASGAKLTDVTSGFRAANRRTIGQYTRHYPAEYLGDTVDSLMTAVRMGHTVTQVPVAMRPRQGGTPSANPWKSMVYLFRALLALLIASTRKKGAPVG